MNNGFTINYNSIESIYYFEVVVYNESNGKSKKVIAILDTGSDTSLVSEKLINEIELRKINEGKNERESAGGIYNANEYMVNVELPESCFVNKLRVQSSEITVADFIIGTDVLSKGNLYITNTLGKTIIRFKFN